MKFYLDAGHGGSDSGATNGKRYEKNDVLAIAKKIRAYLEKVPNVEVKLSRENDSQPTIAERCADANRWGADYFLSIHRDAVSTPSANGCSIWVIDTATNKTVEQARTILDAVIKAGDFYDRKVHKGAANFRNYGVNTMTNMPSALLEIGFISSPKDNERLDSNFDKICEGIAKALCEIMGIKYTTPVIMGDVNGDGKVTAADARQVLRHVAGLEELTEEQKAAADVNKDGKVTAADARQILRQSANLKHEGE